MHPNTPLYEQDFYAWTQEQGALLRDRKTKALDYDNLAEEVESLGKSQQHALESRLEKLVLHLLKWHYQPEQRLRGQSWQRTILEQRRRIDRLLQQNPSLRPTLPALIEDSYTYIRKRTSLETRLPLTTFPDTCPWGVSQILDDDFWPDV
jgi:hypothetical protein